MQMVSWFGCTLLSINPGIYYIWYGVLNVFIIHLSHMMFAFGFDVIGNDKIW